jgi:hypothetical protein
MRHIARCKEDWPAYQTAVRAKPYASGSEREPERGFLGVRKSLMVLAAVTMCALALSAPVQAANAPAAGNGATVTRATLPSGFVDENDVFYPATCEETQVINEHQRKETFNCRFDAAVPAPVVCDTSIGCLWFSDFDGAQATNTHFVITPSGRMVGWANY